jgi:hypothetical protein
MYNLVDPHISSASRLAYQYSYLGYYGKLVFYFGNLAVWIFPFWAVPAGLFFLGVPIIPVIPQAIIQAWYELFMLNWEAYKAGSPEDFMLLPKCMDPSGCAPGSPEGQDAMADLLVVMVVWTAVVWFWANGFNWD